MQNCRKREQIPRQAERRRKNGSFRESWGYYWPGSRTGCSGRNPGSFGHGEGFLEESLTETGDFCPVLICCKRGLSLLPTSKELDDDPENACVLLGFTEMGRASPN